MQSFGTLINTARPRAFARADDLVDARHCVHFMFALVLSANLFADAIRDAFDPRAMHR
jgi:peptide/nickel transport system permease protein